MRSENPDIYLNLEGDRLPALVNLVKEQDTANKSALASLKSRILDKQKEEVLPYAYLLISIEEANELQSILKEKAPTSEGGWTTLHFARMQLMEAIDEYRRHTSEKSGPDTMQGEISSLPKKISSARNTKL